MAIFSYFAKEQKLKLAALSPGDQITVRGNIVRSEFATYKNRGWLLCIDLGRSEIVAPTDRTPEKPVAVSPAVPGNGSTSAPAPIPTTVAPAEQPTGPDRIERPEFHSTPKSIVKNLTSITSMMVRVSEDGSALGFTSDVIATASVDDSRGRDRDNGARFIRKVGKEMQTSFDEAVRAVRVRYPHWAGGPIEVSFGEKYTEHDGGSAATAFGVLMLSALEGIDLDTKCAITGDLTVDWKVRKVGAVAAKLRGATLDKCLFAVIPADNAEALDDMSLLYGQSALWEIQTFSISTLLDAVAIVRSDRSPQLTEAMQLFAGIQPKLAAGGKGALADVEVKQTLSRVLELAPNHLSARSLLVVTDGKAPRTLSLSTSLYQAFVAVHPFERFMIGQEAVRRGSIPAPVVANSRKQLTDLRRIANKDAQPIITDLLAIIAAAEAASENRGSQQAVDERRTELAGHLSALSTNRELMERLVRDGGAD